LESRRVERLIFPALIVIILNHVPIPGHSLQQIKDLRNFVLEEGGGF
jgi:hypothetical protein